MTLRPYPILNSMLDSYIYLQNPAWVFSGNVVSHMDHKMMVAWWFVSKCIACMCSKRRFWKQSCRGTKDERDKLKKCFENALWNSRRQLTPVFDKPAFSRFPQNCEPLFVVEIFGEIVKRQVCQKRGWVADGCSETLVRSSKIFVWGSIYFLSTFQGRECSICATIVVRVVFVSELVSCKMI